MEEKARLPKNITLTEAKKEHIPSIIIQPPTEEELRKHRQVAVELQQKAASLLPPNPRKLKAEFARRGEVVWTTEILFLEKNWDKLEIEERETRFRAALVNLCEAYFKQGKFEECIETAWEGMRIGANCQDYLQRANAYIVALNTPDDYWCNCQNMVIEEDKKGKVFGVREENKISQSEIVPALQVVDEVPSRKHNGEDVLIVRCNECGMLNAVRRTDLPAEVLDGDGRQNPSPQIVAKRRRTEIR